MEDPNPNQEAGREEVLFAEALGLSPDERRRHLDLACGGDVRLRRRVERLIEAHEQAGDLLEAPPVQDGDGQETRPPADSPSRSRRK